MLRTALYVVAAAVLIVGAAVAVLPGLRTLVLPGQEGAGRGEAAIGGPFVLTDHTGQRVTEATYDGKLKLVFFGFTFCPDICPTELMRVGAALDMLAEDAAAEVVALFVSIDPERDTPEAMATYLSYFHPGIVGLTGTPEEVQVAAKAYRVYYAKAEDAGSAGGYTMNHTALVYLMDRDGTYLRHFSQNATEEQIAEAIRAAL
ncbi:SCO family protein [Futiania mangrovi]|uniref:SCO family protein n=1 Tax=Futiania mangrovi TaxID=2959716 RepID=A0A9J6PIT7_9PROT|nr:SCO family protein [Futiania mangrovii]MCP1336463.1 SCO family protein [Futiania mangrovii]